MYRTLDQILTDGPPVPDPVPRAGLHQLLPQPSPLRENVSQFPPRIRSGR